MKQQTPVEPARDSSASTVLARPRLVRVNDRIYSATGYAISNVLYVITGASVVVIDTTESMAAARASFDEFRKICTLPVSYIVYTHFHGDHIRGAKVFHEPSTRVIAHRKLPEQVAYVTRMMPYRKRVTSLQFGFKLKPERRGTALADERESGYVPPDILVDEDYRFREGDLSFELHHTEGETVDHLMVWIPELQALFPGDLYYSGFPMLSNPMRPDRPILAWAESLEKMRTFHSERLVPSHSAPISGGKEIDQMLANYSRAIRFVHDETLQRINEGKPLDEIRSQVKLPADLAALPYLRERYGKVAWSVNGVFRQHTGWYGFNPAELNPIPRKDLRKALLDVTGGPAPLVKRSRQALKEGKNQLALELADLVLDARPGNPRAKAVRLRALRRLAAASQNGVEQNIYRTAAKEALAAFNPLATEPSDVGRLKYTGAWTRPAQDSHLPEKQSPSVGTNGNFKSVHNYGYWLEDTETQSQARENLLRVLMTFITSKAGITGIDISPEELDRYKLNEQNCRSLEMNAGSSFDNIICTKGAFQSGADENFLSGAFRALKPGGRLLLADAVPANSRMPDPAGDVDLYFHAGFERVEVIDATKECGTDFRKRTLRLLRDRWLGGMITLETLLAKTARIVQRERNKGYYLLVSAQKGRTPANGIANEH